MKDNSNIMLDRRKPGEKTVRWLTDERNQRAGEGKRKPGAAEPSPHMAWISQLASGQQKERKREMLMKWKLH